VCHRPQRSRGGQAHRDYREIFPALPDNEAGWHAASFLAGSPERIAADLRRGSRRAPARAPADLDQEDIPGLELFAREVMPKL
jgi:hypothetical protein